MQITDPRQPWHPDAPTPRLDAVLRDSVAAPRLLSHVIDDAEQVRTRMVRHSDADVRMLTLALHALEHGSPEVTAEFIERVRDRMAADLAWLRTQ